MQLTMLKNKNRYFWLLLALLTLAPVVNIYAEGSRTLYPDGATGYRAYLRSTTNVQDYYPFPNLGTHYVYAKPGETIALASSAQRNNTDQKIRLYAPNNPTTPVTLISYEGNGSSRVYYGNIPNIIRYN